MPRNYKPSKKKNYKKYNTDLIEMALKEYNTSNKSFLNISRQYGIPKSVLHRHNTFVMKQHGGQTILSPAEEQYLVEYINVCSEWGYPLEPIDFRFLVKGYLDKSGIEIKRFRDNLPGPDFVSSFLKRHKDKVSKRLSQNIKRARAAVSPEIIEAYFGELESSLQGVPSSNIVNYDETNLSDDPGRKRVLVKRAVKYPERIMYHTKGSTSIMMAAAADGFLLPPYVVYKAQNMYDTWRQNGPKGCRYNCTPSGWFDGNTFQDWVRTIALPYFNDKTCPKILIGDNLASHLSIDLIKECQESDIKFIFLPANSTHLTQPLDVAFFRPLKSSWRDILLNWKKTDGRTQATIPKNIFPSLLKQLLKNIESNVSSNVLAGFNKCGISPINKQIVLDRLPSYSPSELSGFKEVIDETVLSMLKEMRYGTKTTQRCNKKKKLEVIAGRSVENVQDEKSDENDLEEVRDNDNEIIIKTDNKHKKTDSKQNCEASCSKQIIEEKQKTTVTKKEKLKAAASSNKKTDMIVKKTTNKSLIKKTKTKKLLENETKTKYHYEEVEKDVNMVRNYNKNLEISDQQNPTVGWNNVNIIVENESQIVESKESNTDGKNRINDMDLELMPVVFEDFFTIRNEVEVITSEKSAFEDFRNNTKENIADRNNKIQIISDEIVNLQPKYIVKKLEKVKVTDNIKKPKYYRNDAELVEDLMGSDSE